MAQPLQAPFCQFFDSNGNPLAGGKVFTYLAGTSTPQASYTDASGATPNANPVILDSAGRAQIWLQGFYKITVTDALNNLISTADNITASTTSGDMNTSVYDPANIQQQLVGISAVQTLTNKTLTSPVITGVAMGSQNPLINSDMSIVQRGTSFAAISGATPVRTLDGWFAWNAGTGSPAQAVSQITSIGLAGFNSAIRVARPAANTSTTPHRIAQILETLNCYRYAGKTCVLSFWARRGAGFSGASNNINVRCQQGTGTNQGATSLTAGTWAGITTATDTAVAITTSWARYTVPVSFLSTTAELSVEFSFTPVGTAAANDHFEITGVQLDTDVLTDYINVPFDSKLRGCQRFLWKTFNQAIAPVQNAGFNTGEINFPASAAGAAINRFSSFPFPVPMLAAPAITIFNPNAANAQMRDQSAAADCTGSTTFKLSDNSFSLQCTGNAGTFVGNPITAHVLASAEL